MVMAVGGMPGAAAELKWLVLVDGFIMTNCVLGCFSSPTPICYPTAFSDIAEMKQDTGKCWMLLLQANPV